MEIILVIICSIIAARYLERKMKVASIAYSVLFVFSSVFYLFSSDFKWFVIASKNILGQYYPIVHETLRSGITIANFSLSAIIVLDTLIAFTIAVVSTIVAIKGIKKLLSKIKFKQTRLVYKANLINDDLRPNLVQINNGRNNYLVLCQLRN